MTSKYDSDAFELNFEDAVNDMHQRTDRGNTPSAHVWTSIRSQLGTQAETADPRANGPDRRVEKSTMQRNRAMDAALSPNMARKTGKRARRFGWMALLAAGMVGIMVITSVWMNGSTPPPDDRTDLAWAPGMGTVESSPVSSPLASGTCSVDPLTPEEVMATVLNPNNGSNRIGGNQAAPASDTYWEGVLQLDPTNWAGLEFEEPADPELKEQLAAFGNRFWDCYSTGTTYQVWSMMHPIQLQRMVLEQFPVIRSEEDLRSYIESTGPRLFRDVSELEFTGLAPFAGKQGQHVDPESDGVLVMTGLDEMAPLTEPAGLIRLDPVDEGTFSFYLQIQRIGPDAWVVSHISTGDPRHGP